MNWKRKGTWEAINRGILEALKSRLKGKVVIMGMGNSLKGDDGAGPFFINALKKKIEKVQGRAQYSLPLLIDAGEAPENYLGKIAKVCPDVVMIVDAASFGGRPGEVRMFEAAEIEEGGFTTHTLSPSLFMRCLKEEIEGQGNGSKKVDIFLLGIEPKKVKFNAGPSREVKKTVSKILDFYLNLSIM